MALILLIFSGFASANRALTIQNNSSHAIKAAPSFSGMVVIDKNQSHTFSVPSDLGCSDDWKSDTNTIVNIFRNVGDINDPRNQIGDLLVCCKPHCDNSFTHTSYCNNPYSRYCFDFQFHPDSPIKVTIQQSSDDKATAVLTDQ